jgi:hypothetical protein
MRRECTAQRTSTQVLPVPLPVRAACPAAKAGGHRNRSREENMCCIWVVVVVLMVFIACVLVLCSVEEWSGYVYVYVCVCVCVWVWMSVCICVHVCVSAYVCLHVFTKGVEGIQLSLSLSILSRSLVSVSALVLLCSPLTQSANTTHKRSLLSVYSLRIVGGQHARVKVQVFAHDPTLLVLPHNAPLPPVQPNLWAALMVPGATVASLTRFVFFFFCSFTHSISFSFIHSFSFSFTHSLTHSLTHSHSLSLSLHQQTSYTPHACAQTHTHILTHSLKQSGTRKAESRRRVMTLEPSAKPGRTGLKTRAKAFTPKSVSSPGVSTTKHSGAAPGSAASVSPKGEVMLTKDGRRVRRVPRTRAVRSRSQSTVERTRPLSSSSGSGSRSSGSVGVGSSSSQGGRPTLNGQRSLPSSGKCMCCALYL